jgi:hypothetical protein
MRRYEKGWEGCGWEPKGGVRGEELRGAGGVRGEQLEFHAVTAQPPTARAWSARGGSMEYWRTYGHQSYTYCDACLVSKATLTLATLTLARTLTHLLHVCLLGLEGEAQLGVKDVGRRLPRVMRLRVALPPATICAGGCNRRRGGCNRM